MEEKDYRFSSYTIVTGLDKEPDCDCLIHGYTGAIDVVDKSIVEFLESNATFHKSDIPCSAATQDALEKRGYITGKTREEEIEYVKRLANALYKKETIFNNSFTFVVSYDCNFRCPYCFEKGIKRDATTFTQEMTDKAYKAIMEIAPEEKLRSKIITLYGGEPLLRENKNAVSYIINRGRELGFKFFAITNGYDLDYYEEMLLPDTIKAIQVTIDGLGERHNQRRIHKEGFPTFDRIIRNIGMALEKGVKVIVRVNTDKDNVEDLPKLQQIFSDLHYTENELFTIHSALLRDYPDTTSSSYNYLTPSDYIKRYKELDMKYVCQDHGLYNKISSAIRGNRPININSTFCNSQTGGYVLDPFGNIYPCWEIINRKEHCLASLINGKIVWNEKVRKVWKKCSLVEDNCISCRYSLLCNGGCPAQMLTKKRCIHIEKVLNYSVNMAIKSIK